MRDYSRHLAALADAWKGPARLGMLSLLLSLVLSPFLLLAGSVYLINALPRSVTYSCVATLAIKLIPEEHWNPGVRELYPMRQLVLEKTVMRILHRLGLPPRKTQRLPPEIWAIILEHAIHIPYATDVTCDPRTFHLLVRDQKYWGDSMVNSGSWGRDLSYAKQRKYLTLREVCRAWAYLIHPAVNVWVGGRDRWDDDMVPRNTQRLDFRILPESYAWWENLNQTAFLGLAKVPRGLSSLHTVAVKNAAEPDNFEDILSKTLFAHGRYMTELQSLILYAPLSERLAKEMQRTFSGIKSLTLKSSQPTHGTITLSQLEILILDIPVPETYQLWFPALLHCYLGRRYVHGEAYKSTLLPGPSNKLQSLELHDINSKATTSFWLQHPSLQSLVITNPNFQFIDPPPLGHPLEHVAINRLRGSQPEDLLQGLTDALDCLQDLRFLSIPHIEPVTWDTSEPLRPIWYSLFMRRHLRRSGLGLVWLGGQGVEITEHYYWKRRSVKPWEKPVALLIYGTLIINMFWLGLTHRVLSESSVIATFILWIFYHSWAVYDHYAA